MNEPKRQHYVPRCYLKGFRDPLSTEDDPWIFIFEKEKSDDPRRQRVKETLISNHIYTFVDDAGKKDYVLENALAGLESKYPPILERINRREPLTEEEHANLCLFVSAMLMRTLRKKEMLEDFVQQMIDMAKQVANAHGNETTLRIQELEQKKKDVHKESLVDSLGAVASILARMNIGFACAEHTTRRFITSDDPCRLYNPDLRWFRAMSPGLNQKNIELSLPLNPETMLEMSWQNYRGYVRCETSMVESQNRDTRGHSHMYFLSPVKSTSWYWFFRYPLSLYFFGGLIRFQISRIFASIKMWYDRI